MEHTAKKCIHRCQCSRIKMP